MKKKILLIGGGGHCPVIIEALRKSGRFSILGIVDPQKIPDNIFGIPAIGTDDDLPILFRTGCSHAVICVGSVGHPTIRIKLAQTLKKIGFSCPAIVHPSAIVATNVALGEGTFIAAGAIICPGVKIGNYAIVNTGAIVDHHCTLGDFVHIAPGVTLSGGVGIGRNSHIGTGSSVIENRTIGCDVLIGAGSVVVNDIADGQKAFGNPCIIRGK
jgi:UDP-perosamine 4-acetyltransferase